MITCETLEAFYAEYELARLDPVGQAVDLRRGSPDPRTRPVSLSVLDDFQQTLDKFKVPAREQAELKAIVDSTRSDIVVESVPGTIAHS
jgi:hypothetical protein